MYFHTDVNSDTPTHPCTYASLHTHAHMHLYTPMHICISTHPCRAGTLSSQAQRCYRRSCANTAVRSMHAVAHTLTSAHINTHTHTNIHTQTYTHTHTQTYTHTHTYTHVHLLKYIHNRYTHVHTYFEVHTCTHTHTHTHVRARKHTNTQLAAVPIPRCLLSLLFLSQSVLSILSHLGCECLVSPADRQVTVVIGRNKAEISSTSRHMHVELNQ